MSEHGNVFSHQLPEKKRGSNLTRSPESQLTLSLVQKGDIKLIYIVSI